MLLTLQRDDAVIADCVSVFFLLYVIGTSSAQWMRNAYHMKFHEICRILNEFWRRYPLNCNVKYFYLHFHSYFDPVDRRGEEVLRSIFITRYVLRRHTVQQENALSVSDECQ